ncbi:hypothetical protein [Pedobacter nanyangensis]|uniref:hypothetical protein n=1 Tax=Pedobacter nanyangensis TaxID=1562389 RepID=UPI000DE34E63|nr:hypothetical protein [Pedobacter nanyangensis]
MISIIVFSKDRPLQLEAYLTSLMYYSGLKEQNFTILYKATENIKYEKLIKKYSNITWIDEQNYAADLKNAIEKANDFLIFGCDDVFFKEYMNINHALDVLRKDEEVFSFHLRLGRNIENKPRYEENKNYIKWDWTLAKGMHWNYPWEVSAAVYRKKDVLSIIDSLDFNLCRSPNYFEDLIAQSIMNGNIVVQKKLAAFASGKALTLTVNRVQDDYQNPFDSSSETSIEDLYRLYEEGMFLDWKKFENAINTYIHVDSSYFSVTSTDLSKIKRVEPRIVDSPVSGSIQEYSEFKLKWLITKNMLRRRTIRVLNIISPQIILTIRKLRKSIKNG